MAATTQPADNWAEHSFTESNIWLFGSLAYSFDAATFKELRKLIHENKATAWLLQCVSSLPSLYDQVNSDMSLHDAPPYGSTLYSTKLVDLVNCFITRREPSDGNFLLPNALLIPLAVVSQLADFTVALTSNKDCHNLETMAWHLALEGKEVMGLCTGILAALAIASSESFEEFKQYARAAVHLGMLVGTAIDHRENVLKDRAKSISVFWNNDRTYEEITVELEKLSTGYISVYYDHNRVTMVVPERDLPGLMQKLRSAEFFMSEIDLYGAFHSIDNKDLVNRLAAYCSSHAEFQLPDASQLYVLARSGVIASRDHGTIKSTDGPLHTYALKCILQERCNWFAAVSSAIQTRQLNADHSRTRDTVIACFGSDLSIPPSLLDRITLIRTGSKAYNTSYNGKAGPRSRPWVKSDIAVVGMACKVAGADDLEEFWDLLKAGKSQHQELHHNSRIPFRDADFQMANSSTDALNEPQKWFANLIRGHDEFDHRFFKKTARESSAMDPQQRHLLQVAYQAVQQSGYFSPSAAERETNIGCFVGTCQTDYESNAACHIPSSFTATGNLRGFLAGKVSHFFGWTGPGLAIDTACSSSLVAVHQACNSILSGECNMALACGSHVMTSPGLFQSLAAAHFLSPTGQCRPFDVKADGYCRGEGAGAVFLKRLDAALADRDPILGVIAGTTVQQNLNHTPLFVPNAPSLSTLFHNVLKKANITPGQISVVEAHGTGTAVGDPVEYSSIRQVLGGENRSSNRSKLLVSSVKGLIGHLECTSGVVSLIKVLLMLQKCYVPPQASFAEANPALQAKSTDCMHIPTAMHPWSDHFKAALVNNYGASGSNAAAVVIQAPDMVTYHRPHCQRQTNALYDEKIYPFWISGNDETSICRYARALRKYISSSHAAKAPPTIADISFNLAYQSNRNLESGLVFGANSIQELDLFLQAVEEKDSATFESGRMPLDFFCSPSIQRPRVVLCFGGQVSTFIGIDRNFYENVAVFQKHLNDVDKVIQAQGVASILPSLFQRTAIADKVQLQLALFATQYASAYSWIDSGVQPIALVGHSFGELTALCISNALSLEDTVKMILRRATAVRDHWGPDPGSMIVVDGDASAVAALLRRTNSRCPESPAIVACYNGPRNFTLAGSTKTMDVVFAELHRATEEHAPIKGKWLNVTNAFHCGLVDPLLDTLREIGQELEFRTPSIHVETATEFAAPLAFDASFVANHMRNPVYFASGIRRIARKFSSPYSPLIFLEAGTSSSISSLAARVLAAPDPDHTYAFHGLNLCADGRAWNSLVETTQALWKLGMDCKFWAHHKSQKETQDSLGHLLLPPYQFNPHSHWLDLKITDTPATDVKHVDTARENLITVVSTNTTAEKVDVQFRVNTKHTSYQEMLSGHHTIQTAPICPATVQIGLITEALSILHPGYKDSGAASQVKSVEYQLPICRNSNTQLWIRVSGNSHRPETEWHFTIFSAVDVDGANLVHTTGYITFVQSNKESLQAQLEPFARLIRHDRVMDMLRGTIHDADDAIGSRTIYRLFSDVVEYSAKYRRLQRFVCRGNECAARITSEEFKSTPDASSLSDAYISDAFFQLGGLWINCITNQSTEDIYLANGVQEWIRTPTRTDSIEFHAFANHLHTCPNQSLTDVFIFDATDGRLVQAILGMSFVRTPRTAMQKVLTRLSSSATPLPQSASHLTTPLVAYSGPHGEAHKRGGFDSFTAAIAQQGKDGREHLHSSVRGSASLTSSLIRDQLKSIIADLVGVPVNRIDDGDNLIDFGIDSLIGIELINEIESKLSLTLPNSAMASFSDISSLVQCVMDTGIQHKQQQNTCVQSTAQDWVDEGSVDPGKSTSFSGCSTENKTATSESSQSMDDLGTLEINMAINTNPLFFSDVPGVREKSSSQNATRELALANYVNELTDGFSRPLRAQVTHDLQRDDQSTPLLKCILITGASGGLGCHLVAEAAIREDVSRVFCLNRKGRHHQDPWDRQKQAMEKQGLELSAVTMSKLRVLETDLTESQNLGLTEPVYGSLVQEVTHIVHNAWLMHFKWPVNQFEPQLRIMANILSLARDISTEHGRLVTFLFNSSIAAVACHPVWTGCPTVEEACVPIESVFANGYAEAKHVCERMLDSTLRRHRNRFRAATIRIGQIAGGSINGHWNSTEHVPLLIKSSQTIRALPDLHGSMAWIPIGDIAGGIIEILTQPDHIGLHAFYHMENPARQPWENTIQVFSEVLRIPVIPFSDWLQQVRQWVYTHDNVASGANPAYTLVDFFQDHFTRISCGGLLMSTNNTLRHFPRLSELGPISHSLLKQYIDRWIDDGFLKPVENVSNP